VTLLVKMLMPILTPLIRLMGGLNTAIAHGLAGALTVVTALLEPLAGIFRAIGRAIEPVTRFIRGLARTIGKLKLPDWLIPGSPTPLERGLRGIASAAGDVRALSRAFAVPESVLMGAGRARAPALAAAPTAGGGGGDVHVHLSGNFVGGPDRVAKDVRRALLRLARRNPSMGI
jgi:hypothetical protein